MIRRGSALALLALIAASALSGCAAPLNYLDPAGPRYAGRLTRTPVPRDTLRLVSFNVKYGQHIDRALQVLREEPALRDADLVFLQEMDESGTRTIADSLGMAYVYYPSTVHPVSKRDFGNAVLSRYPIQEDRKILLPHRQRFRKTRRSAVAATIQVGDRQLRVYSVHIGTVVGNGPRGRREQLATILADADAFSQVVVAGDFNSSSVPELALGRGFTWPTRNLGHTNWWWDLDHVLLRGVTLAGDSARGVIRDVRHASDHHPIWTRILLPAAARAEPPPQRGSD